MLYDKRWEQQSEITKPEIAEWRQILLKAADILEQQGWCRGSFQRSGRYCTLGAINKAAGFQPAGPRESVWLNYPVHPVFEAELMLESIVGDVADWNDAPAMRSKIAIETLREVARGRYDA